jgi:ribosome-associated protein
LGLLPKGQEGKTNAQWIILDYFDVVVHVFLQETREYYQLEELWSDAECVEHE